MSRTKVSIIGGGRVGITSAYAMLLRNTTRELILFDRDVEKMKGEQLEFEHSLAFLGATTVKAAESLEDIRGSDVIVYTAGVAQKPGETRLDLAKRNIGILKSMLPDIMKHSPDSILLFVANPVDILTYEAAKMLNFPKGKVFGSGTSLDSARFRFYLSEILKVNPKNIHAYVLGEHGDSSFPVIEHANVGGQPLLSMNDISKDQVYDSYQKTRNAAGTVIAAKGGTFYAIGVVVNQLVDAVLRDTKRVFPVSVPLHNEYGFSDVAISVPCVLGKNGVERILTVTLSEEEKQKMSESVRILKELSA